MATSTSRSFYSSAIFLAVAALSLSACQSSGDSSGTPQVWGSLAPAPGSPPAQTTPPAQSVSRNYQTDAVVFTGSGTWAAEISSIESILTSNGASFQEANSAQMNAMTTADLAQFGVMIFPGGAGGTEAGSLSAQTHANLRYAVQVSGVGYLGFCAGSFIAAAPAPAAGQDVSYGLGVLNAPVMGYYYLENQNVDHQMTLQSFPDGTTEDILWYGGPVTPNLAGGVVAKYPDGNPSITEAWSGNGYVVVSGGHPTATQAILSSLGMTSTDGTHLDLVWKLFNAALHQQPLPTF